MGKKEPNNKLQEIFKNYCLSKKINKELINDIVLLKKCYKDDDLALLYSYFLINFTDCEILISILKQQINSYPTLYVESLIDILMLKNTKLREKNNPDDLINLRCLCAKKIGDSNIPKGIYPLLYCLNSKNENYKIRFSCAEALGRTGNESAVNPLIAVISDKEEKSLYLKESATYALGLIGNEKAIDSLINILENCKGLTDKYSFLKERVIEALGKINTQDEKIFNTLKKALVDESVQIRINTIDAIMNSGNEKAAEVISEMLNDNDEEVVKNAIIALYNIEGKKILDDIINNENSNEFVKIEAQKLKDECEDDEN